MLLLFLVGVALGLLLRLCIWWFLCFVDTNTKTLIPPLDTSCETGDDGLLCAVILAGEGQRQGMDVLPELRLLVSIASVSKSN